MPDNEIIQDFQETNVSETVETETKNETTDIQETIQDVVQETEPIKTAETPEAPETAETPEASENEAFSSSVADELSELLEDYEWKLMQTETGDTSIDNASIYAISCNTHDIFQALVCVNLLLSILIGIIGCNIFSHYVRC